MHLPPIDRSASLRPAGPDLASLGAGKVVPVPPVNPSGAAIGSPGVVVDINLANMANKPGSGEAVFRSVSDPAQRDSEAATAARDWTIRRPEPEEVKIPPPEPISKMLLEFVQSMWRASGTAVEMAQQQSQVRSISQDPNVAPGVLAKEVLTYAPTRIRKPENL